MKKQTSVYCFFFIISLSGLSQDITKSIQTGLKITADLTFFNGIAEGFGGQFVYRIKKHGGIETGLYYQQRYEASFLTEWQIVNNSRNFTKISGHRLQIPFLYRFDSKALNFSAGPLVDFRIGTKIKSEDPDPTLKNYKHFGTVIKTLAGLSRTFYLSYDWMIEPEIQFNYIIGHDDGGISINITARKKIF